MKHPIIQCELGKRSEDITGLRFGRFTVVSFAGRSGEVNFWNCVCECGSARVIRLGNLKRPGASCGCYRVENVAKIKKKHGMHGTRPYRIWANMLQRVTNPRINRAHCYYHRGIKCCREWRTFEGFWKDMAEGYKDHLTIERKNNDLGYNKENCVWATYKEQANNRRCCVKNRTLIEIADGEPCSEEARR